MPLSPNSSAAEIAEEAMALVEHKSFVGKFSITTLFPKSLWNTLNVGQRKQAGKIFKQVMSTRSKIHLNGPNSANLQGYESS